MGTAGLVFVFVTYLLPEPRHDLRDRLIGLVRSNGHLTHPTLSGRRPPARPSRTRRVQAMQRSVRRRRPGR